MAQLFVLYLLYQNQTNMNKFKFTFPTEPQPEKPLNLQSSIYPEGHGTQAHFNEAWQSIHQEAYNSYKNSNQTK